MQASSPLKFENTNRNFTQTLNKRVNDYFKENELSRQANGEMVFKSILMISLYLGPLALIMTGVVSTPLSALLMMVLSAFGLSGIGLAVMHDGNHGAYSNRPWVNAMIGYSLNLVGANSFNWRVQHNVLHHSFTNVLDSDEDIYQKGILRLTPHDRWRWFHRYQFIYAWLLYGVQTIVWVVFKDFSQVVRYQKRGFMQRLKTSAAKEWSILIGTKVLYISYIFVLPLMVTPWLWWQIIIGIVLMHLITGFLLAIIFQPAHVITGSEFLQPDENNTLEDNWAIHQLRTTTNFANSSRWFTWFVGGLNFQIEHHLFPNVCHVHYRKISGIVKATAIEFELPYKSVPSFAGALVGHLRLMKELGQRPA